MPEEFDDVESLQNALALERAKNEVLMEQVLDAEDAVADTDVEANADVIPNDDRDFWRGRLIENRGETLEILERMRNRGVVAAAPRTPRPMHNRAGAKVGAAAPAAPAAVSVSADHARALRNRAQEIAAKDNVAFHVAWGRAEKELGA